MGLFGVAKLHQHAFPQADGFQIQELAVGMQHYDHVENPNYVDMYGDEDRDLFAAEDEPQEARRMMFGPSGALQAKSAFEQALSGCVKKREEYREKHKGEDLLFVPTFLYDTEHGQALQQFTLYGQLKMDKEDDWVYLVVIKNKEEGRDKRYWLRWGDGNYNKRRGLFEFTTESKERMTTAEFNKLQPAKDVPKIESVKGVNPFKRQKDTKGRDEWKFKTVSANLKKNFPKPELFYLVDGKQLLTWPSKKKAQEADREVQATPQNRADTDGRDGEGVPLNEGLVRDTDQDDVYASD